MRNLKIIILWLLILSLVKLLNAQDKVQPFKIVVDEKTNKQC